MSSQSIFKPTVVDDVPEIAPEQLLPLLKVATLIDVRRPDEFTGELAHIPGARLVTLGPELDAFLASHDKKNDEIVFICRSGARSGRATLQGRALGFDRCVNLQGGMILWNERKLPTER